VTDPSSVPDLWRTYGRHAAILLASGPAPSVFVDDIVPWTLGASEEDLAAIGVG
jgi:hypothetical protein